MNENRPVYIHWFIITITDSDYFNNIGNSMKFKTNIGLFNSLDPYMVLLTFFVLNNIDIKALMLSIRHLDM